MILTKLVRVHIAAQSKLLIRREALHSVVIPCQNSLLVKAVVPFLTLSSLLCVIFAGTVGVQLPGLQEYGAMGGSTHAATSSMWACQHCTFMNQPGTDHCEMCSLPRS